MRCNEDSDVEGMWARCGREVAKLEIVACIDHEEFHSIEN